MQEDDGRSARRAFVALAATLAIQIYTSLAGTATAVLAPEIAPAFGLSAEAGRRVRRPGVPGAMAASLCRAG